MATDHLPPHEDRPDPVLAQALADLRDRAPETDLWPGIAPRLARPATHRLLQLRWPTALAAALALVAGSAGLTTWLQRAAPEASLPVAAGMPADGGLARVSAAAMTAAAPALTAAIDDLTLALEAALPQLDPKARAQIREALAALDTAIAEADALVRENPDDPRAAHYLTSTLSRKRDVLRTLVATASRS